MRSNIVRGQGNNLPCQVRMKDGTCFCADAPILSKKDSEIRCSWLDDYGPETQHRRLWASVTKVVALESDTPDTGRMIAATIYTFRQNRELKMLAKEKNVSHKRVGTRFPVLLASQAAKRLSTSDPSEREGEMIKNFDSEDIRS